MQVVSIDLMQPAETAHEGSAPYEGITQNYIWRNTCGRCGCGGTGVCGRVRFFVWAVHVRVGTLGGTLPKANTATAALPAHGAYAQPVHEGLITQRYHGLFVESGL